MRDEVKTVSTLSSGPLLLSHTAHLRSLDDSREDSPDMSA
jgi:hypothetical protein